MTTCKTIQPRLTAYLDGELADEHGSAVRGHLRECAACRQIARDEAALRDGLRMLPPIDPPATLWAGVQAQLAAAEVADARKPPWRRAVARWVPWARWVPTLPQLAAGGLAAAAAIAMLTWRAPDGDEMPPNHVASVPASVPAQAPPPRHPPGGPSVPAAGDVTADLLAEPAQTTASYERVIEELTSLATSARASWTDERKAAFDTEVEVHRHEITGATQERRRHRAQRALIRYLQGAVVRGDVMLASGGTR